MLGTTRRTAKTVWTIALCFLGLCATDRSHAQKPKLRDTPLTVEESMDRFSIDGEYAIECVAAEPHVVDPIDARVDEQGRIWVVEMRDYPMLRGEQTPSGSIKVLQRNGRGETTATLFADELDMPTGLALWKNGVVVTLAGEIAYFPDEDRDLRADSKQSWIVGLSTGNEQLRANHPTLASDGWWYVASGLRGGKIEAGQHFPVQLQNKPIDIGSRDFRFHVGTGRIQPTTGPSQFGLSHDSFGDRFLVSNRNPARKVIFEESDLVGNPLAGLIPTVVDVLPFGAESVVKPTVDAWTTSNLHAGQYTAACAVTVSPDRSQEGEEGGFSESIYVCEPTGSLVTRDRILRKADQGRFGWQVISKPREKTRDWLTSTDPWFRPVNLSFDRDGSLLVVDMHRAVIEHPQWVPEELANRIDEQYGNDCGRVYAIRPVASKSLPAIDFAALDSVSIVRLVASRNIWIRNTAVRLILQLHSSRQLDEEAHNELVQVARTSTNTASAVSAIELYLATTIDRPWAYGRLLENATAAEEPTAVNVALLQHLNAQMALGGNTREFVFQQATSGIRSLQIEALLAAARCANGQPSGQGAVQQYALDPHIVTAGLEDAYMLIALAGVHQNEQTSLAETMLAALSEPGRETERLDGNWLAQALARLLKSKANVTDEATAALARKTAAPANRLLRTSNATLQYVGLRTLAALNKWKAAPDNGQQTAERIVAISGDSIAATDLRVAAVELLASYGSSLELLRELSSDSDSRVAAAAWSVRAKLEDPELPEAVANALLGSDTTVRTALIQLATRSSELQAALLDRLASGAMTAKDLGADNLRILSERAAPEHVARFKSQLAEITNSDRARVVQRYRECLDMASDPVRGKAQFSKNCASCHKIGGLGQQIGPDISDSRTQKPLALLTSILNPNLAVDNNYFRYQLITVDGNVHEGIKIQEDSERIVLQDSQAKRIVIDVAEIEATRHSGLSLMPDGLENQLSLQQMADLISFIKNWRYLNGQVPAQTIRK